VVWGGGVRPLAEFTVIGRAEPAGSKRAVPMGQRWGVIDDNAKSKVWKREVAQTAADVYAGDLLTGPLAVEFDFYVSRPRGHFGTGRNAGAVKDSAPLYPATRPDVLKLARGVEDALTGVVWNDDAQIVDERLTKRYGSPVRVEVRVWRPVAASAEVAA
jgi:Holliday junction resolvase RusA-like endonuclease